jgi:hypothetical protein
MVTVTVWQIPDAVDTVVCASDDGWRYHPERVEQFPDINKQCNVASFWIYIGIFLRCTDLWTLNFRITLHENLSGPFPAVECLPTDRQTVRFEYVHRRVGNSPKTTTFFTECTVKKWQPHWCCVSHGIGGDQWNTQSRRVTFDFLMSLFHMLIS